MSREQFTAIAALGAVVLAACTTTVSGHAQVGRHQLTIPPGPPRTGTDVTVPVPALQEYVDGSGSPRVAISLSTSSQVATWTVVITPGQELVGHMTMPQSTGATVAVHTSFAVHAIPDTAASMLTVSGWMRPATHQAHLLLHLTDPPTDAVLNTGTPDVVAARSQVASIVAAVNAADWTTLAGMLAPDVSGGGYGGQLASAFSGSGITHVHLVLVGTGHLTRLGSGDPAWLQDYTATARAASGAALSQHGALVLVEENGAWWLLSAGP